MCLEFVVNMAAAIRNVVCGITARKSGLQRMGRCHTSNTAGPVAETAGEYQTAGGLPVYCMFPRP